MVEAFGILLPNAKNYLKALRDIQIYLAGDMKADVSPAKSQQKTNCCGHVHLSGLRWDGRAHSEIPMGHDIHSQSQASAW